MLESRFRLALAGILILSASACRGSGGQATSDARRSTAEQDLATFFESVHQAELDRSPIMRTSLGVKRDEGLWDDFSDAARIREVAIREQELERLRSFDELSLGAQSAISYELFEQKLSNAVEDFRWRLHDYPVNQMFGVHTMLPSTLIGQHTIEQEVDARNYIQRLDGFPLAFDQLIADLELRADAGIVPPSFVFPRVLGSCRNLIAGAPFETGTPENELLADFRTKVEKVGFPDALRRELIREAERAMVESVGPAYERLIAALEHLDARAPSDVGVWTLPDGDEYYAHRLKRVTTGDWAPAEVHALGLSEVARIHDEMRALMRSLGFEGTLQQFFAQLRTDERFYLTNDEKGRQAYLTLARDYLDGMRVRMPDFFRTLPKAPIEVRAVEPYREAAAGKAFYSAGTPDGKRPGVFYANLFDMAQMPTYQLEALVYHEAIPGHHLQNSIARELTDLPRFRRFGGYTVYGEGWGLYCESFPRQEGFYRDPYSDFGRLAMELWRACRLVVDSGIHSERWTREAAIAYLLENTPNPEGDCVKAIERYIVMPGQATAYTIGKLEIERLRREAEARMGSRFDLREFHEVILANGPLPIDVLEEQVLAWSAAP
ncbi:MAG: DUF885 domain-containing protein [Planctomycetes bacterium]|nr:DUF885 domain-containing protein [Planctomycetota bacterium]MCB9905934.1 DUF885 domain-containing protein [Planctomycetota bacterium]